MQATTTKITIMATTMEVTRRPFQTVDVKRNGEGTVLQVVQPQLRCVRCRWNSSWAHSLPSQDHDVAIEMAVSCSRFHHGQATDSVSRSREEITVETPSPRMLTPYKASAISIVRFW